MTAAAAESAGAGQSPRVRVRRLGRREYEPLWREMQRFTERRGGQTPDELWFAEHPPVFTLGLAADRRHLLAPGNIPVVATDRGGQVTYHGPGQLMVYPLIDLRRAGLGIRDLVTALEQSVVELAAEQGIEAASRRDAPGVYAAGRKLASVGLRVRRGASYHGMAVNVDVDLEPFARINPCGYAGLEAVDLRRLGSGLGLDEAADRLREHLLARLRVRA